MKYSRSAAIFVIAGLALAPPLAGQNAEQIESEIKQQCVDLPFTMPAIAVPRFPDRTVSLSACGGVPDGHTLNTRAFAAAIESVARAGGGTVTVPPGTWLTGPIRLLSNINLCLERGALVQFSRRLEDFPLIAGYDGKARRYIITPPLHAYQAKNIAVTGEGIFDGAGEAWRYVKKSKLTETQWEQLLASGGTVSPDGSEWWPSKEAMEGGRSLKELEESGREPAMEDFRRVREFIRPDLAVFVQCNGLLLDGVTFQNSPRFHVRPNQSENIIIRNITIRCPWYAQNGDGLDPTSCRNVVIYNSTVDVGDDGLCLKPGAIAASQASGPACENIVIAGCMVFHAHGGFVIGSESYGGVNNVAVRNCVFSGTDVGLRFKSFRGNGGPVRNVFIDGVQMRDIANQAILFDMYYSGNSPDVESQKSLGGHRAEQVTERTPRFEKFSIRNIVCSGAKHAVLVNGLPEMPVRNITMDHVTISANEGVVLADVEGITFRDCNIIPKTGPAMTVMQGGDITVQGGSLGPAEVILKVDGERSENIRLTGVAMGKGNLVLGRDVKASAVIQEP
jgi:polygalacturonase